MSLLSATRLGAVPVTPLATRVYLRQCFLPAVGDADPLWVAATTPSRWRTTDGTLYVAEDIDTVMAEYCRNQAEYVRQADPTGGIGLNRRNFTFYAGRPVGDPLPARAVFSVGVAFARVADLRAADSQAALSGLGISPDNLLADDYGPCPDLASIGESLGWNAVRAQSAANIAGTALAIFRRSHPARNLWRPEEDAARPSVRIAYLTRYKDRERPSWLGR
ncbi:MAG: RES domain-containing protein [Solirubrobacteraceae bacterium]